MNKILLSLFMLFATLGIHAQTSGTLPEDTQPPTETSEEEETGSAITATFDPDPAVELTEIPSQINMTLSEAMNGASPKATFKSGDVEQTPTPNFMRNGDYQHFYIFTGYYFSEELKAQIAATGEFTMTVTLNDGTQLDPVTYKMKKPITATFDPDPAVELTELPSQINMTLSEAMNGASPKATFKSGDVEQTPTPNFMRNGDYQHFYIFTGYYLNEDIKAQIAATGEFTMTVTLNDGTQLDPVTYKMKKPITATFDPDPAVELDEIPSQINMTLSEAMNGASPKATFKSGDVEQTPTPNFMRNGDYQHFLIYTGYYLNEDIKAQVAATGELTMTVTLNDGTQLDPVTYNIKKQAPAITAAFDNEEGSVFAGLPSRMCFSLSEEMVGVSPTVLVNDSVTLSGYRNGSYKDFYVWTAAYIKDPLLSDMKEEGKFTLSVVLNDGTKLEPVTFYLVDENLSWTPADDSTEGKVFSNVPTTLSYTLSEALPAEGKYTAGVMLADAMPAEFAGWDFEVPCTVDGTAVSLDLSALSAEDCQRIVENGSFTAGLTLANKTLSASYSIQIFKQSVTLGYCSSELQSTDIYVGANSPSSGVGGAIRIPAAKLETMKGGTINKLRIAMGTGMERVYAWIRPSLSQPAIVMKAMDTTIDGWQEIEFETPYTITGEEIYIGYSGYQPAGVKAIRTGGNDREDGCWLAQRDSWEDCSAMGYGTLYIQAIGEALLPSADLGVDNARIDKQYYKSGETVKASFAILNSGGQTIDSYDVFWAIDGGEPTSTAASEALATDSGADFSLDIPLAGLAEGIHTLTIGCTINDADKTDEVAGNDTFDFTLPVYETSYPRTILMENFTTERCVNCPYGHAAIHKAIDGRDDTAWLCHHVGYGTDEFTIEESNAFLDFGVLGAPSLMLDRTVVTGSSVPFTIGFTNAEAGGQIIGGYLDYCQSIPAFASITLSNDYDATSRELTIRITGEKNEIFSLLNPESNCTVFLTESGLPGYQSGSTTDTYIHDNVIRAIVTPTFGAPVEWEDNKFSTTITTTLDEKWTARNMKVVACLNKPFNAADVTQSQVLNATVAGVDDLSAISSVTDGSELSIIGGRVRAEGYTSVEVFTPAGIRVADSGLNAGLYIVRATDAAGRTTVIKTYAK